MDTGKLVGVIGDEDTVTGFLLAGVGHRTTEGANFLVVKPGGWLVLSSYRDRNQRGEDACMHG